MLLLIGLYIKSCELPVHMCLCVCVCARVRACVRAFVRACACVHVIYVKNKLFVYVDVNATIVVIITQK